MFTYFTYLKGRAAERRGVDNSHLLVPSQNTCNSQSWTKPKTGAKNSLQRLLHGWQRPNHLNHHLPSGCMPAGNQNWEQSQNFDPDTLIWDTSALTTVPKCLAHNYIFNSSDITWQAWQCCCCSFLGSLLPTKNSSFFKKQIDRSIDYLSIYLSDCLSIYLSI